MQLPGPERIGLLADAFGEQSGLPIALEVHGKPRELAPEARLAVYRTAQEALTNVRRHATPEHVAVRLDYLPESTVLVVEDHARTGTPPPIALGTAANGYGLTGMRERAELLGGQLLAEPTGDGFRVELQAAGVSAGGPGGAGDRPPVRVLLADDQRLVRESLGVAARLAGRDRAGRDRFRRRGGARAGRRAPTHRSC